MNDWNEYYFPQEAMEQSGAISNCIADLKEEIKRIAHVYKDIRKVHIVGSGDCYFISIAAACAFRENSAVEAAGYEAYDYYLEKPELDEKTMVILFSSSGKSLYVLKALEYVKTAGGISVGITNHADSPLGKESREVLLTTAIGVSHTFPTKTTTASLALLYSMAFQLGKEKGVLDAAKADELQKEIEREVPMVIERIYHEEQGKIQSCAQGFLEARCYTFVGSGPARSSAMVGAAKIVETSRGHVTFCNAEEYMHLHGFSVKSPDAVIVIGNGITDHREKQVVEYANDQRARVLVTGGVGAEIKSENVVYVAPYLSELSPWGSSICTMVVLHMFACGLSRRSFKDPDIVHDVNLKKVIELLYTGPVAGWNV